jgi:hypothetical protein
MIFGLAVMFVAFITTMQEVTHSDLILGSWAEIGGC